MRILCRPVFGSRLSDVPAEVGRLRGKAMQVSTSLSAGSISSPRTESAKAINLVNLSYDFLLECVRVERLRSLHGRQGSGNCLFSA